MSRKHIRHTNFIYFMYYSSINMQIVKLRKILKNNCLDNHYNMFVF